MVTTAVEYAVEDTNVKEVEFSVDRKEFVSSLAMALRAVDRKSPDPAMASVEMRLAAEEGLVLRGKNPHWGVRVTLPEAEFSTDGTVVVSDPQGLRGFVAKLPDGKLRVAQKDNAMIVQRGRAKATYPASSERLPLVYSGKGRRRRIACIPAGEVVRALSAVAYATAPSSEYGRPVLRTVRMEFSEEKAAFVATDTNRLSLFEIPYGENEAAFLLPAEVVAGLIQIMGSLDPEEPVLFHITEDNLVSVESNNLLVYSRIVEGRFPNYRAVIPADDAAVAVLEVGKAPLQEALGRVDAVGKSSDHQTTIANLSLADGRLLVSLPPTPGFASYEEELEVGVVRAVPEMEEHNAHANFQVRFWEDVLGATTSDTVTIYLGQKRTPAKIVAEDNLLAIVMPIVVS